MLTNGLLDALIAGLDPAIHLLRIKIFYAMDPRVKPGGDERGCAIAESKRPEPAIVCYRAA